jgi:ABC-type bacteriocin/lantibiotic exporter with double-glycine peptidase domain
VKRIIQFTLCFCLCAAAALGQGHNLWLDVPFVKQSEDGCGSAAISMLLQYWAAHGAAQAAERGDVGAIQRQLYDKAAHGIHASAVEKYVRESGFTVFAISGTWDDLARHLKEGRPLILGTASNGGKGPLHYLVAVGMDSETAALLVNDPARGKLLRIERAAFEKQWQPVGNWTLVAVPSQAK